MFRKKLLYVNIAAQDWRSLKGALVKKGRRYGEVLEVREHDFDVVWHNKSISTEKLSEYELVYGD